MSAQVFGLDIGRSFVKIVDVKYSSKKYTLTSAVSFPTPGGGIMSESPIELKKVSDVIKKAVSSAKITKDKCAVSLIESQVVTRLIQLPNLTDKELSAAINWEAEQYIPLPVKDVNLQYEIISRPQSGTNEKMDVLLVAAPKRVVIKYINVVRGAGLKVDSLETESASLTRAYTNKTDPSTNIIISMGAISTELIIVKAGRVFFTRSIATGGINLTKAIMSEFNLPISQAEQYKQAYGILEDKLGGKVANVLKPILDILITELMKAMEFIRSHAPDAPVSRILICGGGAYLPGLAQFLTAKSGLEVSLGDPWANFEKQGFITKLVGFGPVYSVATGLALRS